MKLALFICLMFMSQIALAEPENKLIGGRDAEPGEFPEVIYVKHQLDDGRTARCSATIIGPRVIMTAAHCVKDNGTIEPASFRTESALEFQIGQGIFKALCNQAPLYRDNTEDHDMALCKTDRDMNVKPASVADHGPELEEFVMLSGYGCTQEGGGGGNNGQLRVGEAKVDQLPSGSNHWFYTRWDSAACFGDSGGPSFFKMSDTRAQDHFINGVISRGNIRDLSLMTNTWLKPSQDFLKDWSSTNGVKICGIDGHKCGEKPDPDPDPDPDPEPEPDCEVEKSMVRYYQERLLTWEILLHQCLSGGVVNLPYIF